MITSATIDAERFARHFGTRAASRRRSSRCPGRTYPVEVRYRPLARRRRRTGTARKPTTRRSSRRRSSPTAEDLWREGPGDILVFLPGEREIRETADLLRRGLARRPYARAARDPAALRAAVGRGAAARVRARQRPPHRARHQRRRDLADRAGHPLRDRLGPRPRQALQPCATRRRCCRSRRVSQAAANQRAGRCGRVAGRHLRAPLRRGRPRGAARLHRAGDPALARSPR